MFSEGISFQKSSKDNKRCTPPEEVIYGGRIGRLEYRMTRVLGIRYRIRLMSKDLSKSGDGV